MFDFFNNKKNYNPNETVLGNLTANQKMSVMNLLYIIARVDGEITKKELEYLNTLNLGFSLESCGSYLDSGGTKKLFYDLNQLSSSQKDYLTITTFELMCCDGRPNEQEYNAFLNCFEEFGYTEDTILAVIEKAALLKKKFM